MFLKPGSGPGRVRFLMEPKKDSIWFNSPLPFNKTSENRHLNLSGDIGSRPGGGSRPTEVMRHLPGGGCHQMGDCGMCRYGFGCRHVCHLRRLWGSHPQPCHFSVFKRRISISFLCVHFSKLGGENKEPVCNETVFYSKQNAITIIYPIFVNLQL